jgi:DUF1365 family protein
VSILAPATPLRSALAEGFVSHRRLDGPGHGFRYRIFMLLIDLDELPNLDQGLRLFAYDRRGVLAFRRRDHLDGGAGSPRAGLAARIRAEGLEVPRGRVELLSQPRVFGHVFNPVSFWYCYDAGDRLELVVAEVNNTFGDRHSYVLPVAGARQVEARGVLAHEWRHKKLMHVSPFMAPDAGTYRFEVAPPAERIEVGIDLTRGGEPALCARLSLSPRPLTDRAIASALVRYPFVTLKVVAAIHYEALRLWAKGAPFWSRPPYDPQAASRGPA